jgi:hypothetical protein
MKVNLPENPENYGQRSWGLLNMRFEVFQTIQR